VSRGRRRVRMPAAVLIRAGGAGLLIAPGYHAVLVVNGEGEDALAAEAAVRRPLTAALRRGAGPRAIPPKQSEHAHGHLS
jgi:hypothetical protein